MEDAEEKTKTAKEAAEKVAKRVLARVEKHRKTRRMDHVAERLIDAHGYDRRRREAELLQALEEALLEEITAHHLEILG